MRRSLNFLSIILLFSNHYLGCNPFNILSVGVEQLFCQPVVPIKEILKQVKHVKSIKIAGAIDFFNAELKTRKIMDVFSSEENDTIILQIESLGGTADAAQYYYSLIMSLKKKYNKRVIAYCFGAATSAAYWIACCADEIVISPGTVIGSIGAFQKIINVHEASKKIGIFIDTIATSKIKTLDPFSDPSDKNGSYQAFKNRIEKGLQIVFSHFIDAVKNARGDKINYDDIEKLAEVSFSEEAVSSGLADKVMLSYDFGQKYFPNKLLYNVIEERFETIFCETPGKVEQSLKQLGYVDPIELANRIRNKQERESLIKRKINRLNEAHTDYYFFPLENVYSFPSNQRRSLIDIIEDLLGYIVISVSERGIN